MIRLINPLILITLALITLCACGRDESFVTAWQVPTQTDSGTDSLESPDSPTDEALPEYDEGTTDESDEGDSDLAGNPVNPPVTPVNPPSDGDSGKGKPCKAKGKAIGCKRA